ncbi:MAG: DUF1840 domain-containing protein [Candidatus Accumulibacter sp.]|jgi:hypothetical protein|nr:DUF1840 domain-containing protein [Accumulibacter sp.]
MLLRLTSSTSGKMVMFAEHAHVFFGWIGKECVARGVFTTEQLPEAIACLRLGADREKQTIEHQALEKRNGGEDESEADENLEHRPNEPVTLEQRARPLLRLMEQTLKEQGFIVWEASGNF